MKDLKVLVAVLLFFCPLSSQSQKVHQASACGDLAVSLDPSQHSIAQPAPGKALIYFIQDTDQPVYFAYPIVCVFVDGGWVGASTNSSYFAVAVKPGLHDLSAESQSPFPAPDPEFDHLVAKPGGTYFFRVRLFLADTAVAYSSLAPLRDDDAIDLIAAYPQATAYALSEIASIPVRISATAQGRFAPGAGVALNAQPAKIVRNSPGKKPKSRNPTPKGPPRERLHSGSPPDQHHGASAQSTGTKSAGPAGTASSHVAGESSPRRTQ